MDRRRLLQAGSLALAGLAGCLGGDDPAPATDEPDTTTDGSLTDGTTTAPVDGTTTAEPTTARPTTTAPVSLDVSPMALQPGLIKMNSPDSSTVIGDAGRQYLFLSVSAPGTAPPREELALRFDGRTHAPFEPTASFPLLRVRNGTPYGPESDSGWVLFDLPERGDAGDAALTWPGGEWAVPGPLRSRLAAPLPTLTPTVEVPDTLAPGETPTITVTVDNEGSVAGTFVAAIDRSGPSVAHIPAAQVRERVPAGGTTTVTVEDSFYARTGADDDKPDATYYVTWPGGSTEKQVRLVDPTTTAPGG